MASSIGIDIGSSYTKVVELEHRPNVNKLANRIIFKTPYLSSSEAEQKQIDGKSFWQEIAKSIPLEKIKLSSVSINIPASSVTALTLLLPRVSKRELDVVAQTEARRKMIPTSGPNHIFENFIVGERIAAKILRFEVVVVRTDKVHVQQLLDLFKNIDTFPRIITISSSTLFTLFPQEILNKKDLDAAFVDIGLASINTSIFREGRLYFLRNTAFGLQDIIQDISSRVSISQDEAEGLIKEKGVPEVTFDLKDKVAVAEEIMRQKYEASLKATQTPEKEEVNLLELRVLWQAHIERIVHELRRSLAYYKEQSEGRRVEYIYFLGGGCQIKNLVNLVTEQIGGECHTILPFKNLWVSKEEAFQDEINSTPIFTNATSLALSLGAKARVSEIINFLPSDLKRKEMVATRRLVFLIVETSLIVMFSLLSLSMFFNNRSIKNSMKGVEFQLNRFKKIADRLKDLSQREKIIRMEGFQIEETIRKRAKFYFPLKELTEVIPEEVLLTSLTIRGNGMPEAATVSASLEGDQQDMSGMDSGLESGFSADMGMQPSPDQIPAAGAYRIEMKAEIFADYEKASKIIQNLRSRFLATPYFKNISITPIKLEEIVPQKGVIAGGQEILLTKPRLRAFTLTADIVANSKTR